MLSRDTAWFARRGPLHERRILSTAGQSLRVSEQRYTIAAPLPRVFAAYCSASPAEVWPRERVVFRCAFAPGGSERLGAWPGMQVGMKVFADLLVVPLRFLRIMVGVEVTRLEPGREIRYDYLDGSTTAGFNSIQFIEDGDATRVRHYSEYVGTSPGVRAVIPTFQPILHVGFVDGMHRGMKARIEGR